MRRDRDGRRPGRRPRGDAGQTATELLGLLVVVAATVTVLVAAGFGAPITDGISAAICRIGGGSCSGSTQSHLPADQCEVSSHNAELSVNVTLFSVVVGGRGKYALSRSVDPQGKAHWFVQVEGGARLGAAAQLGGGASAGDVGADLKGKIKAVLRGDTGTKYEFKDENAARDFVTTVQHQAAKDALAPALGPFGGIAHWAMDKLDGRRYDPPAAISWFYEGGAQLDGSATATEGIAKGTLSGSAAEVLRVQITPQPDGSRHTTYSLKINADLAGRLGLLQSMDANGRFAGEVVLALEYDDSGRAITATFDTAATVSATAGPTLPFGDRPAPHGTLSPLRLGGSVKETTRLKLDLNQGNNRDTLADALRSVGLPVLTGDGAAKPPSPMDGVRGLRDLFVDGAPGTYASANRYDVGLNQNGADVSAGEGLTFGVDGSLNFEDAALTEASYYEPGQGWVRWQQCFR